MAEVVPKIRKWFFVGMKKYINVIPSNCLPGEWLRVCVRRPQTRKYIFEYETINTKKHIKTTIDFYKDDILAY